MTSLFSQKREIFLQRYDRRSIDLSYGMIYCSSIIRNRIPTNDAWEAF